MKKARETQRETLKDKQLNERFQGEHRIFEEQNTKNTKRNENKTNQKKGGFRAK